MKWILSLVLSAFLSAGTAFGQYDLTFFYQPNFLPVVDPREFVDVQFNWDIPGKAQAYLNSGLTELKEGSPLVALDNLQESINLHPFWASYYYRGICHNRLYQFNEAQADFLKALELQRGCAEAHLALGDTYQLKREYDKALTHYEKAARLKPSLVHAHYRIGNIYFINQETNKAIRQYEKCTEIDATFPNAYLGLGMLRFSEKKKDRKAIVYFDKAIEVDPTYRDGLFWRGLAYITLGDLDKALEDWGMLVRVNPNNPFVLIYRGTLLMQMKNYELAFRDFENAVMSNSEDQDKFAGQQTEQDKRIDLQAAVNYLNRYAYGLKDEAFLNIQKGFCYLVSGQKQQAIKYFHSSAALEPSASAYYLTAIAYEHINRFDSALHFYNKALTFDPDIFDAYKKRAIFRYELKDWKGSLSDFNQMIRLQPESLMTYRLRGTVRAHIKDFYGCIVDITRVLDNDANDAELWKTRGFCRENVQDSAGALSDYRQFLRLDQSDWRTFQHVAQGYLQLGDTILALDVLREYHKAYPLDFSPQLTMAKVYLAMQNYDRAKETIRKIYSMMNPGFENREVYFSTIVLDGLTELNSGSVQHAISKFSEALKINPKDLDVRYYRYKAYNKSGDQRQASEDLKILKKMNYPKAASL